MKFLSILVLNIALISAAHAAEQDTNQNKQPASAEKAADKNQSEASNHSNESAQKQQVLKTQFLSKRPYMEKTAK